ncbi:MAG: hypothetical protein KDA28_00895, partial [Phycisphaerales bacterium]|nr:hypothetical protein [Phycisphaerales bacterium]
VHPSFAGFTFGDVVHLLEASSILGGFETIALPPLPATLAWNTHGLLVGGSIRVECGGDLDGSQSIDYFDLIEFLRRHGDGDATSDVNGDGSIDDVDVAIFLQTIESGC